MVSSASNDLALSSFREELAGAERQDRRRGGSNGVLVILSSRSQPGSRQCAVRRPAPNPSPPHVRQSSPVVAAPVRLRSEYLSAAIFRARRVGDARADRQRCALARWLHPHARAERSPRSADTRRSASSMIVVSVSLCSTRSGLCANRASTASCGSRSTCPQSRSHSRSFCTPMNTVSPSPQRYGPYGAIEAWRAPVRRDRARAVGRVVVRLRHPFAEGVEHGQRPRGSPRRSAPACREQ